MNSGAVNFSVLWDGCVESLKCLNAASIYVTKAFGCSAQYVIESQRKHEHPYLLFALW